MQAKPDFNHNSHDSQNRQLNISKMSVLELVSRFLMFYQAGRFAQARPYLAELVNRQDEAEGADND